MVVYLIRGQLIPPETRQMAPSRSLLSCLSSPLRPPLATITVEPYASHPFLSGIPSALSQDSLSDSPWIPYPLDAPRMMCDPLDAMRAYPAHLRAQAHGGACGILGRRGLLA